MHVQCVYLHVSIQFQTEILITLYYHDDYTVTVTPKVCCVDSQHSQQGHKADGVRV